MEIQEVNITSKQTTQPQVTATAVYNKSVKGSHPMKQNFPWRYDSISIVESSESSDDDSKNRTPNRSMEDLTLATPPIIVKSKPKISLEAIPISPGFLDNTPDILNESNLSVLNDSTPIENN